MRNFIILSFLGIMGGCVTSQNYISPGETASLNQLSCVQLKKIIYGLKIQLHNKKSHYAYSKPYISKLGDAFSSSSAEMKEIEIIRQRHDGAAQIYNNRKCGEYIPPSSDYIPMPVY